MQMTIVDALRKLAAMCPDGDETIVADGAETAPISGIIGSIIDAVGGEQYVEETDDYVVDGPDTPFGRGGQIVRLKASGFRESIAVYRVVRKAAD